MKPIRRRDFLKGVAATGAAVGFPTIVPAQVVAGRGRVMPNDRVNVGQIGCGNISDYFHRSQLRQMDDVRVVATCDAFRSRAVTRASQYNKDYGSEVATVNDDFRELLAREDVDAVIVAVHDNWHTPMSIAAVRAGKDVYCQKPLALDYSQTPILREAVRKHGRVFQFGTQYRSQGRYRQMVELVRNGYIGELERIDVWSRNVHNDKAKYHVAPYGSTEEVPVPDGFNFDAWQGPSPMVPYTVDRCTNWGGFHCPETSLGFLAGCAIHPLGVAQWGNRSDDTSPVRYEGTGNIPDEGIYRTLEHWDMSCEYANGVILRLMDTRAAQPVVAGYHDKEWRGDDGVVFHGTEGWIGNISGGFDASDRRLWKNEFRSDDERLPVSKEHNRNFIDCVKSREEPICPVEMAIRCDAICHLTRAAALTGKAVEWDPEKEKVVGNPEAAKMLGPQPVREKWRVC
ncbi:Gfo/Idh/MocA family oxidoreductase [Haloferula sp. A504]|uniref:Gfo/Idh/MocA family oxidoreductase n=1 Tax=Haloferula sp. A504 TaxID=3373601 RepID=UPI0031C592D9|nr:Gfo/Idh/MocA family oxidoreductase [Verrucomicrobiaceae bacterium E54]